MLTVKGEIDIARTQRDGQDDSERERAHLDHQRRPYNLERYGCNASSCEDGMNGVDFGYNRTCADCYVGVCSW